MKEITFALLSDGSSDKRLFPILIWLLRQHCPNSVVQGNWVDFRRMSRPPKTLSDRIVMSLELYPCDLLFIHRDAENQPPESRRNEITSAINSVSSKISSPPAICIIPVRMQEAWLLFDENAIRKAASNPNGKIPLSLPGISSVETLPDPKTVLYDLLKIASELSGRRLKKLAASQKAHLVAEYIKDFSPLRKLMAFKALETDLINFINAY